MELNLDPPSGRNERNDDSSCFSSPFNIEVDDESLAPLIARMTLGVEGATPSFDTVVVCLGALACAAGSALTGGGRRRKLPVSCGRAIYLSSVDDTSSLLFVMCPSSVVADTHLAPLSQSIISLGARLIMLETMPSSGYIPENDDVVANGLRCIATRRHTRLDTVPYLASPNFITGLSAALLTACELRAIDAIVYVSLVQNLSGVDAALAFAPVLERLRNQQCGGSITRDAILKSDLIDPLIEHPFSTFI